MGTGRSKMGGGGGGGDTKTTDKILKTLNDKGVTAAGDVLNDATQAGDVLILENGPNKSVEIYGKTYNDEYYPITLGGQGVRQTRMDSDAMVQRMQQDQGGGTWSLHKYSGEVKWHETPTRKYDTGDRSATIIPKLPSNLKKSDIKKVKTVNGYDVYDLTDAVGFFKRVAIKKG